MIREGDDTANHQVIPTEANLEALSKSKSMFHSKWLAIK
jgi:hypothetical protein